MALIFVDRDATGLVVVSLAIIGQIGISIGSMVLWPFYRGDLPDAHPLAGAGRVEQRGARGIDGDAAAGGRRAAGTGSASPIFLTFGVASFAVAMLWLFGTRETAGRKMTD